MRNNTKKMELLVREYQALRKKLFGKDVFVVPQKSPDWDRYDQLLMWMYPWFRTAEYVNPMSHDKN